MVTMHEILAFWLTNFDLLTFLIIEDYMKDAFHYTSVGLTIIKINAN